LGVAACAAGGVEFGLGLSQHACLPPALCSGIDAVARLESLDGRCECLMLLQFLPVVFQLAQRFGHVRQ